MKTCNICHETKPIEQFRFLKMNKNGSECRRAKCIVCENKIVLDSYHSMPHDIKVARRQKSFLGKEYHKRWKLNKHYGLTLEQYHDMIEAQDSKCAICETEISGRQIKVDHDHETGKVRKLLCHKCNTCLGLLEDNAELLLRAASYLREHK